MTAILQAARVDPHASAGGIDFSVRGDANSPTDSILRAYEDRSDIASIPGSLASMMRKTTETGDIGQFSFGPAEGTSRKAPVNMSGEELPQHQARQLLHHNSKPWLANRSVSRRPSQASFHDGSSIASGRDTVDGERSHRWGPPPTPSSRRRARSQARTSGPDISPMYHYTSGPYPDHLQPQVRGSYRGQMPGHYRSDGNLRLYASGGPVPQTRRPPVPPLPPFAQQIPRRGTTSPVVAESDRSWTSPEYDPSIMSRSTSAASTNRAMPKRYNRPMPQQRPVFRTRDLPSGVPNRPSRRNRHAGMATSSRTSPTEGVNPAVSLAIATPTLEQTSSPYQKILPAQPSNVSQPEFWDYSEGYMDVVDVYANESSPEPSKIPSRAVELDPASEISSQVEEKHGGNLNLTELGSTDDAAKGYEKELESPKPMPSPRTMQKRLSAWNKDPTVEIPGIESQESDADEQGSKAGTDELLLYHDRNPKDKQYQRVSNAVDASPWTFESDADKNQIRSSTDQTKLVNDESHHRLKSEATSSPPTLDVERSLMKPESHPNIRHPSPMLTFSGQREGKNEQKAIESLASMDEIVSQARGAAVRDFQKKTFNDHVEGKNNKPADEDNETVLDLALSLSDTRVEGGLGSLDVYPDSPRQRRIPGMSCPETQSVNDHLDSRFMRKPRNEASENIPLTLNAEARHVNRPDSDTIPRHPRAPPPFPPPPPPDLGFESRDLYHRNPNVPLRSSSRRRPELSDVTEESTIYSPQCSRQSSVPFQDGHSVPLQPFNSRKAAPDNRPDFGKHSKAQVDTAHEEDGKSDTSVSRMEERFRNVSSVVDDPYNWRDYSENFENNLGGRESNSNLASMQNAPHRFTSDTNSHRARKHGRMSYERSRNKVPHQGLLTHFNDEGIEPSAETYHGRPTAIPEIRVIPPTPELLPRAEVQTRGKDPTKKSRSTQRSVRQKISQSRLVSSLRGSVGKSEDERLPENESQHLQTEMKHAYDRAAKKQRRRDVFHRLKSWLDKRLPRSHLRKRGNSQEGDDFAI